ncbi:DinB family protein [Bacillus sp. Bva_UNVM-123]|uniref:DinB family protein n=1 Tax=Bacillus sp. Bva_UNVM-123 TaxID=2829798 RepID=UPI00391F9ED1
MALEQELIILHYEQSIERVKDLRKLSEEQWRRPIDENKWTIAEIIGHFIPWDEFVLTARLPYFFQEGSLPKGPDVQQINNEAASKSRNQTKDKTIEEFIEIRRRLINALNDLDEERWQQVFYIGTSELTLYKYLSNMREHDDHHFEQIRYALQERPN